MKVFLQVLDGGRIAIGAMAVGIAQACLDASLKYARERIQFGQSISKFQAIQFKLADMATNIELARLMYLKAAWLKDNDKPYSKEASIAILLSSEAATKAALEAIQIYGGDAWLLTPGKSVVSGGAGQHIISRLMCWSGFVTCLFCR